MSDLPENPSPSIPEQPPESTEMPISVPVSKESIDPVVSVVLDEDGLPPNLTTTLLPPLPIEKPREALKPAAAIAIPDEDEEPELAERPVDPALLYLGLLAVTLLGLRPLSPDARYAMVWSLMIVIGVVALLFDRLEIEIPTAGDMAMGIGFGIILSFPLLTLGPLLAGLRSASRLMFVGMPEPFIFQSLAIAMPAAETLLFRGAIQSTRGFIFAVAAASLWSIVLFFPQLQVAEQPAIGIAIGAFFVLLNLMYSYLKVRFGLFASWTAQITASVLLLFVSRLAG
jgi:hypothetical protein